MGRTLLKFFDRGIEFLFYALIFLVPLVFAGNTSELFEFNKMWLTFGITTIICFFWFSKMVITREFRIQRTPLDIPIILFLLSQVLSTIFSLDPHVSFWGYYSRFNGGLLSYVSYILLYYAFASNFLPQVLSNNPNKNKHNNLISELWDQKVVRRMLYISVISGVFVALWALPSHFGYDPTCLVFRGNFDVSCWTADFQPKVRIFGTLGQPDWLAAYLAILIPISMAFCISFWEKAKSFGSRTGLFSIFFGAATALFYLDLLFSRAKSGIIATLISVVIFVGFIYLSKLRKKENIKKILVSKSSALLVLILLITFIVGTYIPQVDIFTLPGILNHLPQSKTTQTKTSPSATAAPSATPAPVGELGGTDSGIIRLLVWKGAIDAWKNNPIFGTGVETFAFAYYKYRPPQHNLTSEWNYLYNKAHNEYLNFMATTGTVGILTYLSIIALFLLIVSAAIFPKINNIFSFLLKRLKADSFPYFEENNLTVLALTASFISILITDFFGFSVVITNLYLFLIPLLTFILLGCINSGNYFGKLSNSSINFSTLSKVLIVVLAIPTVLIIIFLVNSWRADADYALGQNYDQVGDYQKAYQPLHDAVALRSDEPVFKNELAKNDAVLAEAFISQPNSTNQAQNQKIAQSLAQEAIATSNDLTTNYPNNLLFWKNRVSIYYTLAQVNPSYLPLAAQAMQKAAALAPTSALEQYNLGVLIGQNGDSKGAVKTLEYVVSIRPTYTEAHYALGLFYHDLATAKDKKTIINQDFENKAVGQMHYILDRDPNYPQAKEALSTWGEK